MRKFLALGASLGVFGLFGVGTASANGVLPVIIHTCDAYKISQPTKGVKTKDGMVIGTYSIVDLNNNVVATADSVEIYTSKAASCIAVLDVDADAAVINGLLTDELFITVKSCGVNNEDDDSSDANNPPPTCIAGSETVVLTDGEAVDTVLDDAVQSINVVIGNLQAQIDQEILDRQAADAALQQAINTNTANISTNTNSSSANTAAIGVNASGIAANSTGIATNATGVAANMTAINSNATDIATNASGVAANSTGIATNATGIAANMTAINSNATDIATNASGIATNASGVATNASGIATNASGIATNASGVATNAAAITSNTNASTANATAIAGNTTAISTNTGAITNNTANITSNTNGIALLNGNVTTIQTDISALQLNKQERVVGICPLGSSIRVINPNGTVACEVDNDTNTTYTAGLGLLLNGTAFSVNTNTVQARVVGSCPVGSSIRSINSAGGVVCEAGGASDNMGNHTATQALNMNGSAINNVSVINVVNNTNRIKRGNLPSFGSAASFDPNTNNTNPGLIIEHGDSESSGIYMDGETMVMWSPGNNGVLRVYDEDAFSSGPIFEVKGDRTVVGEHRGLVSGAVTGYDDDGSQDCPGNRVARGFDADAGTFGAIDRIRLNCAYVK